MTTRVKLLKRILLGVPGPKVSVRQATGAFNWRVNISADEPFSIEQREKLCSLGILSETSSQRTGSCSILDIELDMALDLRPRKPVCSWCGSIWETDEEASQCGLSH